MTAAISNNPPIDIIPNMPLVPEKVCSKENASSSACLPSNAMIRAGLQEPYPFDSDIHQIPTAEENVDLSKLQAVYDLVRLQESIRAASPLQIAETERMAFKQQLTTAAIDILVDPGDASNNDHCWHLLAFSKQAYLDLHTELAVTKFQGGDANTRTILCAKSAVLHISRNLATITKSESPMGIDDGSIEARLLDQWSHEGNIGLDIMRIFVATWNQIRNSLLKERLMEIAEIKELSKKAVAALIKQGQEKFMQDTISAWASIASSVVQLVPIGIYAAFGDRIKGGKTLVVKLDEAASTVQSESKALIRHAKAQEFGNVMMVSRAFGEGVQGVINLFAARKGLDAAYAGAEHEKVANMMQAANIRLEYLNAQESAAWQNILQVLGSMIEQQNRVYDMLMRMRA